MLTQDQKDILAAMSIEEIDILASQAEIRALSDADAITRIDAWLPTGARLWQAKKEMQERDLDTLNKALITSTQLIKSINNVMQDKESKNGTQQ